jgi:hypothetical protein
MPMTAEEFIQQYDHAPFELDKGQVVETNEPSLRHGFVCANIACRLGNYVREHQPIITLPDLFPEFSVRLAKVFE